MAAASSASPTRASAPAAASRADASAAPTEVIVSEIEDEDPEEDPPKAEARALPTGATSLSSVEMIAGDGAPAEAADDDAFIEPIDFFTVFSTTLEVSAVP